MIWLQKIIVDMEEVWVHSLLLLQQQHYEFVTCHAVIDSVAFLESNFLHE
jgi:hypothetical protein